MAKTIDEVFEKLAERIARLQHGHHPNAKSKRDETRGYVAAELAQVKAVVEAAEIASWPSHHSFSKDVERDHAERRQKLRAALSKLMKEQS